MKKIIGITALMLLICIVASIIEPNFLLPYNIQNIVRRTSLFGIIGIGAAFVIITGGIDLSIGSVIGLTGCLLPHWLVENQWPLPKAIACVLLVSLAIGFVHGLLITKVKLQPFIVTLCGLLIYRGLVRWYTGDQNQGFGDGFSELKYLESGVVHFPGFSVPTPFFILLALAVSAAFVLNNTVYGRYLFAVGRNQEAARFSGINTDNIKILAYVICSVLAGIAGMLFALNVGSVQPSAQGEVFELYAIAAAVLGGCSLRGGEGSILGVVIGTALMRVLYTASNMTGIPTQLEYAIVGLVILAGAIADEAIKRVAERRRLAERMRPPAPAEKPAAGVEASA